VVGNTTKNLEVAGKLAIIDLFKNLDMDTHIIYTSN